MDRDIERVGKKVDGRELIKRVLGMGYKLEKEEE